MGVVTQPISITELALPEGALCPRAGHYKINEPCDAPLGWFGRRHTKTFTCTQYRYNSSISTDGSYPDWTLDTIR